MKQALAHSLSRLGTDYLDLYQLHEPDPAVPIADTLGALDDLVREGKVREIGCSNFTPEQLREADRTAPGAKFVSVQNEYSLLHRDPELGVLDECKRLGLGFLPYFPLFSGLLTGKYRQGQAPPEGTRIQEGSPRLTDANLEKVEKLIKFAESQGHSLLELAMSWLLTKQEVSSVIAGATKADQVRANAAAVTWKLKADQLAEINRLLE